METWMVKMWYRDQLQAIYHWRTSLDLAREDTAYLQGQNPQHRFQLTNGKTGSIIVF
jgi:hypothetical protein